MNIRILIAIVILLVWGVATVRGAPGWVHGLFIAGVFLLIYGIVKREAPPGPV